jgi:uracil-DNA glycosylase
MKVSLPASWEAALEGELKQPYFAELGRFVDAERATHEVFPSEDDVFSAFRLTPLDKTRVLLLGQDPYHDAGQAHGLCFSVKPGIRVPRSLANVYKELEADLPGFRRPPHGYLAHWAGQGILMLNAVMTVRAHASNSHKNHGWERFTDAAIRAVNARQEHVVFVFWGNYARTKAHLVDRSRHTVIEGAHPSPLAAKRFLGCRAFSKVNAALVAHGQGPIDWQLPMAA